MIIDQLAYVFGHVIASQPMSVLKFTDYLDFISSWMTVGPPVRRKLLVVGDRAATLWIWLVDDNGDDRERPAPEGMSKPVSARWVQVTKTCAHFANMQE